MRYQWEAMVLVLGGGLMKLMSQLERWMSRFLLYQRIRILTNTFRSSDSSEGVPPPPRFVSAKTLLQSSRKMKSDPFEE